ncbi:hypothetical protein PDN18_26205 [Bacillus cereus]|nr:hypothetical protein [Bacillus cereus]
MNHDAVSTLDKKYKKHRAFPANINPEDVHVLLEMEKIVKSHLTNYMPI